MRTRTRILTPVAASVLLLGLAACGESGSSGTGGDAAASSSSGGSGGGSEDCAPVAGDKLVVLEDAEVVGAAAVGVLADEEVLVVERPERDVPRG